MQFPAVAQAVSQSDGVGWQLVAIGLGLMFLDVLSLGWWQATQSEGTTHNMPPAKKPSGKKRGPAKMTAEHKAALAAGRKQSRHESAYLEALEAHKPKRGRKRTPESIKKRLAEIEQALPAATGIKKLELAQSKINLEAELSAKDVTVDLSQLRETSSITPPATPSAKASATPPGERPA